MRYHCFIDPSGGSSDSMTMAIARTCWPRTRLVVLVGVWERKPPFSPDQVVEEFAAVLKDYRITSATGDRYGAAWVVERFREHEIQYTASAKTKSEIFLEALALVNSGRVRFPSERRLRAQLESLERRASRSGRDSVDHPPSGHDDAANAACGALVLAAAENCESRQPICEFVRGLPHREGQAPSYPHEPSAERRSVWWKM